MRIRILITALAILFTIQAPADAWWPKGHGILTRASIQALPEGIPEFFRAGETTVAHCAVDPDLSKNRGTKHLERANHPSHYFNFEHLKDKTLPVSRFEFGRLCGELELTVEAVGTLPYEAAEWTERLALAFAEHRKWPDNEIIRQKCLVYAGHVAHYAQEICQPLNLTIHWDGRLDDQGKSPRKKTHERMDSLIQFLKLSPSLLEKDQTIESLPDLMAGISDQIAKSREVIDVILDMDDQIPSSSIKDWSPNPKVEKMAVERARESTRFTASLILTAWEMSSGIRIPGWIDRTGTDKGDYK
jgi:hypothetical protein